jgi:hypothetical protein
MKGGTEAAFFNLAGRMALEFGSHLNHTVILDFDCHITS